MKSYRLKVHQVKRMFPYPSGSQTFLPGSSLDLLDHWLQLPIMTAIHCIGQQVFCVDSVAPLAGFHCSPGSHSSQFRNHCLAPSFFNIISQRKRKANCKMADLLTSHESHRDGRKRSSFPLLLRPLHTQQRKKIRNHRPILH